MTSVGESSLWRDDGDAEPEFLPGGIGNGGGVVRVGDTVRRPQTPSSPISRAIVVHLETVGFERAQRYLGIDAESRDVFTFVVGDVPLPPYPTWAQSADTLGEVATLLRDFHQAMEGFVPPAGVRWSDDLADPGGGDAFCHNDLCPENAVFQDGRAVALIDFDLAAPGHALWDVARTARLWGAIGAPGSRTEWSSSLDPLERLGIFARAYGVEPAEAERLINNLFLATAKGQVWVQRRVKAGEPAFVEMWDTHQLETRYQSDAIWLKDNRQHMMAAVRHAHTKE